MFKLSFKTWVESAAEKMSLRSIIVNFLQEKMSISDEEVILNMQLKDIDESVVSGLLRLGVVQVDSDLSYEVKNGDMTVSDLIDRISED